MATVTLTKDRAVKLYLHCGFNTAGRWSAERLAEKFDDLIEVAEARDAPEDEQTAKDLLDVCAAVESGDKVQVTDAEPSSDVDDDATKKTKPKKEKKAKVKEPEPELEAEEEAAAESESESEEEEEAAAADDEPEPEAKPKKEKKAKEPKEPKEPKPKKEKKPKAEKRGREKGAIMQKKNRSYYSGLVLAKHGMPAKITDDMIAEVQELLGDENDKPARATMASCYHAIKGFLAKVDVPQNEAATEEE